MSTHESRKQAQRRLSFSDSGFDVSAYFKTDVPTLAFATAHGALFHGDCLHLLPTLKDECIDTVFADPPFNLGKAYGSNTNDQLPDHEYIDWCRRWLAECVRVLKPGGSLFVYNLPKWNVLLGAFLTDLNASTH